MIDAATYLTTFFWVMLCFFTFISVAIMVATVINVIRLKNVRLHWKGGKLGGYPLFSTLFLVFIIGMSIIDYLKTADPEVGMLASYLTLGTSWFYTSFFMSKCYITDYGIVKNINDTLQTLAWHQVRDFVEYEREGKTIFTFFYLIEERGGDIHKNKNRIIRIDIEIPLHKLHEFRRIISYKLGRRFDYQHTSDTETKKEYR